MYQGRTLLSINSLFLCTDITDGTHSPPIGASNLTVEQLFRQVSHIGVAAWAQLINPTPLSEEAQTQMQTQVREGTFELKWWDSLYDLWFLHQNHKYVDHSAHHCNVKTDTTFRNKRALSAAVSLLNRC